MELLCLVKKTKLKHDGKKKGGGGILYIMMSLFV